MVQLNACYYESYSSRWNESKTEEMKNEDQANKIAVFDI